LFAAFFVERRHMMRAPIEQNLRNVRLVDLAPTAKELEELAEKIRLIERLAQIQKAKLPSDDSFVFKV
jgi:hypothetical protein